MSRKARPTLELVGPMVCNLSQARFGVSIRSLGKQASRVAQVLFVFALLSLAATFCPAQTIAAETAPFDETSPKVDPHFAQKIQQAGLAEQEKFRTRISIADAVGDNVPTAAAKRAAERRATAGPPAPPPSRLKAWLANFAFAVAVVLTAGLLVRKLPEGLVPALNTQFNPWAASGMPPELLAKVRAEESSLAEFLAIFRSGPLADPEAANLDPAVRAEKLSLFYQKSVHTIVTQRQLLQEIERSAESGRQKLLGSLRWEMHVLRGEAGVPELLPVWQLAFAVEGLLKQLTDNAANITPSTLRTLAGGVELIGELSRPGIEPDLLTRRPLRLLAVDDEPISRKAVSAALKRALNEPDLAENGEAALALADRQPYDVIFLDVEMPGMDGFELCSRIHLLPSNPTTPIVFVTSHSDFVARSKSALSGGSDLIGKPFLTFEITVKALTLALRGRMLAKAEAVPAVPIPLAVPEPVDTAVIAPAALAAPPITDSLPSSLAVAGVPEPVEQSVESQELATEFLTRASAHLTTMREAIQKVFQTVDEAARQELLSDVFLRIHSFTPRNNLPALHPAIQLSKALENLLRKLLEKPANITGSTLFSIANGVELLDELCGLSPDTDLMTRPPIRLLVVDDDLVARRAVAMALQMAFEKPEVADSGEIALTLAGDRPYDVIFMDVQMPGMDGFEACTGIRRTALNRATPVVFVTGQNDFKTRARMGASGGSDFVAKPFLTSEITLKALTFALRGRLDKLLHVNVTTDELPTLVPQS